MCNNKAVKSLIRHSIKANSELITFDNYNYPIATDYAKKLCDSIYPKIVQKLKTVKNQLNGFDRRQEFLTQIMMKEFPNCNDLEIKVLSEYADQRYMQLINAFNEKLYNKSLDSNTMEILESINRFVKDNIYQLLSNAKLPIDDNNMIEQSWLDEYGNLLATERNILHTILLDNAKQLCDTLNISSSKINVLIDKYIKVYGSFWEHKIYDLVSAKNSKKKKERSLDLLNKDDPIGSKTKIDYDITADHVRNKPIIIIQDINTKKNYVMFGPNGSSHGFYIQNKLSSDAHAQNINIDQNKMGYGYLLGSIAFVDKIPDDNQFGFTNEEIVNILKSDPRIQKVYQTSAHPMLGGGFIKRLAKIIR